ncbi:MAG: hypothetical protein ACI4T7_03795 [Alloprevotella sp.]
MLDDKLTQDIRQWLDSPQEQRSLELGAEMLLRLNRNRYMHAQILRRRNFAKLEYELQKHLRIRLEGLTTREVALMEQEALPKIEESLAQGQPTISTDNDQPEGVFRGRRADHDTLPAELQALYERNGEIYFKMKQLFETLKGMEDATPCDRHELLGQLVACDKEYRDNWNAYDTWSAVAAGSVTEPAATAQLPTAQELQAARKYLSSNKPKLAAAEGDAANDLREKMQQRVSLLLSAGQGFEPAYQSELEALGLLFS